MSQTAKQLLPGASPLGRVALVTGAAAKRSMGRGIAVQLAKDGADVVVADKYAVPKSIWAEDRDWKGLDDVVAEIRALVNSRPVK